MFSFRPKRPAFQFIVSFDIFSQIPITKSILSPTDFHCPSDSAFSSFLPENISLIFLSFFSKEIILFLKSYLFFLLIVSFLLDQTSLLYSLNLPSENLGAERGMPPRANYLFKIQLWHVICRFIAGSSVGQHWHEFNQLLGYLT